LKWLDARAARAASRLAIVAMAASLSGCSMDLLDPRGAVGAQENALILVSLGLMLLVVVPVIALTLSFGWHHRASNPRAVYAPTWAHSTRIEVVVWTVPCVIVAILGVLIWHSRRAPDSLGTPVDFELTAESLVNTFFIPRLGTQVYAMAGMRTQLHLIADAPGTYRGQSAAFSGEGFSDMHFDTVAMSNADFDAWVFSHALRACIARLVRGDAAGRSRPGSTLGTAAAAVKLPPARNASCPRCPSESVNPGIPCAVPPTTLLGQLYPRTIETCSEPNDAVRVHSPCH
jgi:cytochrome o ubiquinol oxidase subunit 2